MFKKILLVVVVIILGLMIYAGFKNPQQEIVREIIIKASTEKIFPYINNSQKMNDWMPWKESDPGVQINYSGPVEGVGSKSNWDSKGQMGTGEAINVEVIPNQMVKTKITYTKPMEMSQMAQVTLTAKGPAETLVRWSVNGHNSFLFRLFGIFCNVDKMVGGEFEKGLAKLKSITEAQ